MRRSPRSDRRRSDRGSVTGYVVCSTVGLIACAGLVFDGGRLLDARIEAADLAENAARAGAQQVVSIRDGQWRLDTVGAQRAAAGYLHAHGASGEVSVSANDVSVTVTLHREMALLGVVGVSGKDVSATRTARAVDR